MNEPINHSANHSASHASSEGANYTAIQSFSKGVAELLVRRRRVLTLFSLLLCLMLSLGILRSEFDTTLTALLSQSDPYLEEFNSLQEIFPSALTISFAFVTRAQKTVFDRQVINAIADLEQHFREIPFASRFSSLLNFNSPLTQSDLFTRPPDDYSQSELDSLAEQALLDQFLTSNLLTTDGQLTFASVLLEAENATMAQRIEIAESALLVLNQLRASHPEVNIQVNSEVLLEQSSQQAMLSDLTTLLPFVILACVLTICYCFRSFLLAICITAHIIITVLSTVGSLGFLGLPFNSISIMAPLVVVIIAVANSVHIISIFKQQQEAGNHTVQAMVHSIAYNFQAITLAAITTIIGFTSLNLCSSPAIQDFGRIVAIGITFAYIFTLLFLPWVLIKLAANSNSSTEPLLGKLVTSLSPFIEKYDSRIFWFFTVIALVTFAMLPLNETDFNRLDFISADSDVNQFYVEVSNHYERGPALIYGIDTSVDGGAIDPAFLSRLENFSLWLAQQKGIESVSSVMDLIKTINQRLNGGASSSFSIPSQRQNIASMLNGYRLIQSQDFPLNSFINDNYSIMRLVVNAQAMSNQQLIDLDTKISAEFASNFPAAQLTHGSALLLFARMDELVTIELLQGYSLSLLLITLCLALGFRSLYFGVLSVLPNILPATMVFGIWGLLVGQLDPFVMMLFSISIGLVVDDTVHILSHYLDSRRLGASQTESIRVSLTIAGPALTITTLVLALGTTILIAASTLYFQQAAKLLVPIVLLALVLDFLYLPTVLKRFDRSEKRARRASTQHIPS